MFAGRETSRAIPRHDPRASARDHDEGMRREDESEPSANRRQDGAAARVPPPPPQNATEEEPKSLQDAGQLGPMAVHSWIERQIREATERGEFDNLPGAGKPLPLADSRDPEWWIKSKLKREGLERSDLVPNVIALRREAETYPEALVEFSREDHVREILADYNRRVVEDIKRPTFGPTVPVVAPRIDIDAMVERWRTLRDDLERPVPPPATTGPALAPESVATVRRRRFRWPWRRRAQENS